MSIERESPRSAPDGGTAAAFEFLSGWADRIFVVSLRRAVERRARISERLAGLRFEFLDAVDKKDLDRDRLVREGAYDESRTRRAFRQRRDMTLGAIGCALSHRKLYEEMGENGWGRMIVLEDDVIPRVPEVSGVADALRELPPSWELCYLGYWQHEVITAGARAKQLSYVALAPLGLSRWRPRETLRLLPRPFSGHLRRAGRHMCAHAYAVSREGARKLAAAQTPVSMAADQLLAKLILGGELEAYVTVPALMDQQWNAHGVRCEAIGSEISGDD